MRLPAGQDGAAPGRGGGQPGELPLEPAGQWQLPLPGYTVCLFRPQIQTNPRVMEPQGRYCPCTCELLLQHLWEPDYT